jgi:hypothetical protein
MCGPRPTRPPRSWQPSTGARTDVLPRGDADVMHDPPGRGGLARDDRLADASSQARSSRRRTGIEPADDAARRPPVLKTGGATRHPDTSATTLLAGLTSSIALRDEDSSRDPWSRCRFAVRRPGSPVASPRSHGMPCRGFVLGIAMPAWLSRTIQIYRPAPTFQGRWGATQRLFLPGLKAGVSTPRS